MNRNSGIRVMRLFVAALLALSMGNVYAQAYPTKPVRFIVPYGPGTSTDAVGRLIAGELSAAWGQPVTVENLTGAGGVIGTQALAKAAPDGYTIAIVSSSHASNVAVYGKLPYDSIKDFKPIVHVASNEFVMTVPPSFPAKTLGEFIAIAKAKPGEINYASPGNGSYPHFATEKFANMAGIRMMHIPYKTGGQAVADVLGGRVSLYVTSTSVLLPYIKDGRLRALAVTSMKRSSLAGDLPTVNEAGVPGYELKNWAGLMAPAGTPDAIIAKIQSDLVKALAKAEVKAKMAALGMDVEILGTTDFASLISDNIVMWTRVARESRMKVD